MCCVTLLVARRGSSLLHKRGFIPHNLSFCNRPSPAVHGPSSAAKFGRHRVFIKLVGYPHFGLRRSFVRRARTRTRNAQSSISAYTRARGTAFAALRRSTKIFYGEVRLFSLLRAWKVSYFAFNSCLLFSVVGSSREPRERLGERRLLPVRRLPGCDGGVVDVSLERPSQVWSSVPSIGAGELKDDIVVSGKASCAE